MNLKYDCGYDCSEKVDYNSDLKEKIYSKRHVIFNKTYARSWERCYLIFLQNIDLIKWKSILCLWIYGYLVREDTNTPQSTKKSIWVQLKLK